MLQMNSEQITNSRLTFDRRKRLEWNENEMMKAYKSFGSCLKDIHDKKLWEGDYASFEEYCQKKIGVSMRRAYQMMEAHSSRCFLADEAEKEGDTKMASAANALNDRQSCELSNLPKEKALEVLKAAMAGPEPLTAATIKRAKAKVIDGVIVEPPAKKCPHCGGAL